MREPTEAMIKFLHDRTQEHVERVKANHAYLVSTGFANGDVDDHDASKLIAPELDAYVWYTWMQYKADLSTDEKKEVEESIQIARFHHKMNNKHHPECWDGKLDYKGNTDLGTIKMIEKTLVDASNMPHQYINEMLCDWCAVSQEVGDDLRKWATKHIGRDWAFTEIQRNYIFVIIDLLEDFNEERV